MIHTKIPVSTQLFKLKYLQDNNNIYKQALKSLVATNWIVLKEVSNYGAVLYVDGDVQLTKKKMRWDDILFHFFIDVTGTSRKAMRDELIKHGLIKVKWSKL